MTSETHSSNLPDEFRNLILSFQKNEITEHLIYLRLASGCKHAENRKTLETIARDEKNHYQFWKSFTGQDVQPSRLEIWKYYWIAKIFGLTFGLKLMERGEANAQVNYAEFSKVVPGAERIEREENEHEKKLLNLIDENRLKYLGSAVLGLNDALVELTGTLAGLTLALQNTRLIAMAGLITGIAAAFSMAASEYLSTKTEQSEKSPFFACVYTGITYLGTVFFLIFPYLLFSNLYVCLGTTLFNAVLVILIFNFYISVAQDLSFKKRFWEMISISFGVAGFSFVMGFFIRKFLGVDV